MYIKQRIKKMHELVLCIILFTILGYSRCSLMLNNDILEKGESFIKDQIEYRFVDVAVNWNEARIVCNAYENGSLAIIHSDAIRDFLGVALSVANFRSKSFWIGAQMYNESYGFQWINGESPYIPDKYFIRRGKENLEVNRTCLAFSRQFRDIAHFINLECRLNRAFICQKPYETIVKGSLTSENWILIGDNEYGIFYDKKTWYESIGECTRNHHGHLASFTNIQETQVIGRYLLTGRPSLQCAWIGGRYEKGGWFFISEETEIPGEINHETKFPPWRFNRTIRQNGCLILDRHINNSPVFVETRCSQKRSYICLRKKRRVPEKNIIIINDVGYVIYYTRKTWENAFETCKDINATMIKVTKDILHDVTYMMGESKIEIQHIWVGGRLSSNGTYFYWIEDEEVIPMNNSNINRFPPWYSTKIDLNYACLNLDRENHNRPMFYGAVCNYPQEFICVQKNLTLLENLLKQYNPLN